MTNLRVVIKESVSRDDINRLAWEKNWHFHDLVPKTEKVPYEKIWLSRDQQTAIHYIEDFLINIPYLAIGGKNPEKIILQIRSSLDTYEREDLRQMFQSATGCDESMHAILLIGAATTQPYDPEIWQYFETSLSHQEPDVRKAAMFATSYVGWREFREPLQSIKESDPDPGVRKYADTTLKSLAKYRWQEDC